MRLLKLARGVLGTAVTWAVAWSAVAVALKLVRVLTAEDFVSSPRLLVDHLIPAAQYGFIYGAGLGASFGMLLFLIFLPPNETLLLSTRSGVRLAASRYRDAPSRRMLRMPQVPRTVLFPARCLLMITLASCADMTPATSEAAYRSAPTLRVAESFRYCTDEQLPECQLGPGAFANVAPDAGVIIGMPAGPVARFDSGGEMVARYGRPGRGPGEYRRLLGAHVERDGRVTLHDRSQFRRLVFSPDGLALATHTDRPDTHGEHAVSAFRDRDWVLTARGMLVLRDPQANQGDSVQSVVERLTDTLPPQLIAHLPLTRRANARGEAPMAGMFEHAPAWDADSDTSVIMVTGPTLRVTRHFRGGGTRVLVDIPDLGRRIVTPADLEREEARIIGLYSAPEPEVEARLREVLAANRPRVPEFHPFADRLRVLDDGTFLVRETELRDHGVRWTLFDSDGRILGQLKLPPEAEIVSGQRNRLLLLGPDERDVPILAWFAVTDGASD